MSHRSTNKKHCINFNRDSGIDSTGHAGPCLLLGGRISIMSPISVSRNSGEYIPVIPLAVNITANIVDIQRVGYHISHVCVTTVTRCVV